MVWFKRVAWALLALLVLLAAAAGVYVNRSFPVIDGELNAINK